MIMLKNSSKIIVASLPKLKLEFNAFIKFENNFFTSEGRQRFHLKNISLNNKTLQTNTIFDDSNFLQTVLLSKKFIITRS